MTIAVSRMTPNRGDVRLAGTSYEIWNFFLFGFFFNILK